MATLASSSAPAPWRDIFLEHIGKMPSPEFVFSTLAPAGKGEPTAHVPHARYCIFRGLWASLTANDKNPAALNPSGIYTSDLPTFTTDIRMNKVAELFSSSSGHAETSNLEIGSLDSQAKGSIPEQLSGSGGGGACEAVWWAKDSGSQFRLKGHAYVVRGDDIDNMQSETSGTKAVRAAVGGRMHCLDPSRKHEWSWETEVTAQFGNLSPGMRGTFKGPVPGSKIGSKQPEGTGELGAPLEDLQDKVARSNFRVVVIVPEEVERIDLSDPKTARRYRWTFTGSSWEEEELWP